MKQLFNKWVQLALTPNLKPNAIKVLTAILDSYNSILRCNGWCYTSHSYLMKKTHMSHQLLDYWAKYLTDLDLIRKERTEMNYSDYQPNLDNIYRLIESGEDNAIQASSIQEQPQIQQTENMQEMHRYTDEMNKYAIDNNEIKKDEKMNIDEIPTDLPPIDIDELERIEMVGYEYNEAETNSTESNTAFVKQSAEQIEQQPKEAEKPIEPSQNSNKQTIASKIEGVIPCELNSSTKRGEALKLLELGSKYRSSFITALRKSNEYLVCRSHATERWERISILTIYQNAICLFDKEYEIMSNKSKAAAIFEFGHLWNNLHTIGMKIDDQWQPPTFEDEEKE